MIGMYIISPLRPAGLLHAFVSIQSSFMRRRSRGWQPLPFLARSMRQSGLARHSRMTGVSHRQHGEYMSFLNFRHGARIPAALLAAAVGLAGAVPSRATDLQTFGGNGGDTDYRFECPPQALLAGFAGHAGPVPSQVSIICLRPDAQAVRPANGGRLPGPATARRAPGPGGRRPSCPGQAVVYAVNFLFARRGMTELEWLRATCIESSQGRSAGEFDFPGSVTPGLGDPLQAFPGSGWQSCPEGELPAGIYGTSRFHVDSIGLICRPAPSSASNPAPNPAPNPASGTPAARDVMRSPFGSPAGR